MRLRKDSGWGLIEMLMALTILNIALLAIVAAFSSGAVALQRAAKISTGATLADTHMELYRALKYTSIVLDANSLTSAQADSTYTADTSYNASEVTASCSSPVPAECLPIQTVTGPDGKRYRIDTYMVYETPSTGRPLKKVTVVVRDAQDLAKRPYARVQSTFDESTGL
jgi:type II secretory pathway pseudopilin PulG